MSIFGCALAGDILVDGADAVWSPEITVAPEDVLSPIDSGLSFTDPLVNGADAIWSLGLINVISQDDTTDTCHNTQPDSGETDVDCGGVCSEKCANGKKCTVDTDCQSGKCNEWNLY